MRKRTGCLLMALCLLTVLSGCARRNGEPQAPRQTLAPAFVQWQAPDGDQVIRNPEALGPEAEHSGYNAVWTEQETGEWLMTLDGHGIVTGCSRTGGSRGWQLYSVSRWSREDGLQLAQDVAEAFDSGKRDIYWDDVPFFVHPEHYRLGVRAMAAGDVTEIDSLEELKEYEQNNKGQN